MKTIELTKGFCTLVNSENYDWLSGFKWYADNSAKYSTYVLRADYSSGNLKKIRMHRLIMRAKKGFVVDHIDGNGLNNQKSNLRVCSRKLNSYNSRLSSCNTSGYKGVHLIKGRHKYRAYIGHGKDRWNLGCFNCKHEAGEAYNKAAIKRYGEFAKLNIIKGD